MIKFKLGGYETSLEWPKMEFSIFYEQLEMSALMERQNRKAAIPKQEEIVFDL